MGCEWSVHGVCLLGCCKDDMAVWPTYIKRLSLLQSLMEFFCWELFYWELFC